MSLPPIVKLAERLLVDIELAVRRFPRYHKYATGADLRQEARQIARLCHRAWRDRAGRAQWVGQLADAVDDLKLTLQVGKRVAAFGSFAQFEALARLVNELGRQVGGWSKQHPKGQNAVAPQADRQRAQILSTRGASMEAS